MKEKIKPEEQRKHLIKSYLDDKEYEKFKIFAKACKCTNSNFVRHLLAGSRLVEFPPADYYTIKKQLVNIGININSLAYTANKNGWFSEKEYREHADIMFKLCAEMCRILMECGAQISEEVAKPSPFLIELLRRYDRENS